MLALGLLLFLVLLMLGLIARTVTVLVVRVAATGARRGVKLGRILRQFLLILLLLKLVKVAHVMGHGWGRSLETAAHHVLVRVGNALLLEILIDVIVLLL